MLAAALVTPALLPTIGWRGMFLVGVIPAFVAWFIRNKLHEPELFVGSTAKRRSFVDAFKLLFKDTATAKISAGIVVLTSVQNFGYYGLMIWMPNFLSKQLGFSLTKSSMWTAVTILGMMFGIWVFGQLADRIGRKPTAFLLFQVGAVIMVLTYSSLSDQTLMLWAGAALRHVRQRHDGRLRRADVRGLSDRGARHGAERALQHRARRRRPGRSSSARWWRRTRSRSPSACSPRSPCST